jgi:small subunit ribosomal protein S4
MEKKYSNSSSGDRRNTRTDRNNPAGEQSGERTQKRGRKQTEYGRQLEEKQKVKEIYGVRERQFKRFFEEASRKRAATGETLLSLLERRLDNTLFRLKLASSRPQARQIIVHGHVLVNGKRVSSPSFLVNLSDVISLAPTAEKKTVFIEQVVDKRMASGVKVPDWLELDKKERKGRVLRLPVRSDIQTPIEEHLIIELFSK